jgi:transposase
MTNAQIEVITSVQRRRRWTAAEKERIVAASLEPGAVASAIARDAGIHPSQLFGWRRQLCQRQEDAPGFAAVRLAPALVMPPGTIEIEFASGTRMRITGPVASSTIAGMIMALAKAKRR